MKTAEDALFEIQYKKLMDNEGIVETYFEESRRFQPKGLIRDNKKPRTWQDWYYDFDSL